MTDRDDDETPSGLLDRSDKISSIAAATTDLPRVMVTSNDARRLRAMLLETRADTDASVHRFLACELDRAIVCPPDVVPVNVVTMNSRVFFRRHIGEPVLSRTLVYDDGYAVLGGTLSIRTPLGVALLGLRDGDRMPYVSREGVRYVAVVERVAYQPEGAGRLQRAPYRYWPPTRPAGDDQEKSPAAAGATVIALRPRAQPQRADLDDDDPGPPGAA